MKSRILRKRQKQKRSEEKGRLKEKERNKEVNLQHNEKIEGKVKKLHDKLDRICTIIVNNEEESIEKIVMIVEVIESKEFE